MRTPLVRGRDFTSRDTAAAPWVAIVNETMADRVWPGENPLGKRFTLDIVPEEQPREVIGVVRDIPTRRAQVTPEPVIYASYLQQPLRYRGPWANMFGQMTFMIRTAISDEPRASRAARVARSIQPGRSRRCFPSSRCSNSRCAPMMHVSIVGAFALAATALAAVGIYGVMACGRSADARIGIRMALGASARVVMVNRRRQAMV
jgi:hypothetical protein